MSYEYKVVPAPVRGLKAKGVKTPEDRFAYALESAINELAADGWEYLRTDTLPAEQREGLMSKTTVFQNMLVFRRVVGTVAAEEPAQLPPPSPPTPRVEAPTLTKPAPTPERPSPDVAAE
ncbi:DUF4177 domain-containing protein [Yoonia sp. 2307UL14-13]|uniref:DUF4177 domain-containing protein n=1 Tax=Yoonia sp. 2307UL14-13 TaxID=3126506 RepID=UPI0030AAD5CF